MNNTLLYNSFQLNQFRYNPFHYTDARCGITLHYIGYMVSGHAKIEVEQARTVEINEGDAFYFPKGCRYQSYWYGEPVVFESYGFVVYPERGEIPYELKTFRPNEEQLRLIHQIQNDRAVCCRSVGLLWLLMGSFLPMMTVSSDHLHDALINKAAEYMRRESDYRISDIAAYCNVSVSGLYAIFQKNAGLTPIRLKHRIQVEKAAELLTTTDIPIEEISRKLGFGTSAFFRKIVFEVTGKTPREIRKSAVI